MAEPMDRGTPDLPDDLNATDAALRAWFDATQATRPSEVLRRAVAAIPATQAPPRAPWLRWLQGDPATRARVPATMVAYLVLLLLAVIAAGILAGSRVSRLPPPFGPAAAGQLVFDAGGDTWVADPDGQRARPLRASDAWEWGATWSRDGARLAFWSSERRGGLAEVWIMDADGSNAMPVAPGLLIAAAAEAPAVSWSPTGDRVAFASSQGALYVARVDGSAAVELTGGAFGVVSTPAWSPDGGLIAFRAQPHRMGSAAIYVITPDGTGLEMVSQLPGGGGGGSHLLADWASGGDRIAYSDAAGDIVLATRVGDRWREEVLVGGPTDDLYPAWSPDGTSVVFVRGDETVEDARWTADGNSVGRLFVVDAGGGSPRAVSPTLVAAAPTHCFAPDGSSIRVLLAQRSADIVGAFVPRYALIDVATGTTLVALDAPGTSAVAACSWQRLAG